MVALWNRETIYIFMLWFVLSSFFSSHMVNFGPLTAEIVSGVWSTPTNFNGFCILAALLHVI